MKQSSALNNGLELPFAKRRAPARDGIGILKWKFRLDNCLVAERQ